MLKDLHVPIIEDGWTSNANNTFMTFMVVGINRDWEAVNLVRNCARFEGSMKGDELAKKIEDMADGLKLNGRVTVRVMDCESSTVVAGRTLTGKKC